MSVITDRNFLLQTSNKLQRFTRKKDDLFNFRCPICGDSQKNKTKCRGYVFRKQNDYFYMCHNCGASMSFSNFLKQVDPLLHEQYTLENYKNSPVTLGNTESILVKTKPIFNASLDLPSIASLPDDHFAKEYVRNRKIPESAYPQIYFSSNYKAFVESFGIDKDIYENDIRLVIPFHDKEGNLTGFQGRTLTDSKIRYITIKLVEDGARIFNINRITEDSPIYVFEGPIDSMFIKNSVAVASSALHTAADFLDKSKLVLVYDNEPRNKEIVKQIEHAIDNHFNVVIWPEMIQEKDVNDMILGGFDNDEICDIMEKHTFLNLRAKLEFCNWKKV